MLNSVLTTSPQTLGQMADEVRVVEVRADLVGGGGVEDPMY